MYRGGEDWEGQDCCFAPPVEGYVVPPEILWGGVTALNLVLFVIVFVFMRMIDPK
jgi:hypothetical protein